MGSTTEELYDQWHEALGQAETEDISTKPWHIMAEQNLGNLTGLRVLEIGCGRGGFSKLLQQRGANLVAADFSPAAVAFAKNLLQGLPHCEVRVADIQAIPFNDAEFDVVISLETLEHVPDPDEGLAELVRVTKPGGKLIITTPNYFGLLGIFRVYRELIGRPLTEIGQPINNPLKLKDRVRKLKRLGCQVLVVDGCGHYLYLPRYNPIRVPWLDNPRFLMKWFAVHSLTVATKRGRLKN